MAIPRIDMSRPECRNLANQIKVLQREKRTWADLLRTTTDPEERDNIIHTIDGIENHIQFYDEQLLEEGCFLPPPVIVTRLLEVVHIEQTQSTQYYSAAGTGAGPDNSIWAIQSKPMLVRVYLRSMVQNVNTISGSLEVMGYNPTSLKYDTFRSRIAPLNPASITTDSFRLNLSETLNFLMPADICWGKISLNVTAWFAGHESEPAGANPSYQRSASQTVQFEQRRIPIVHCFRIALTQTFPGAPGTVVFPAPSFADCQATMAHAQRMYPMSGLDIRDRGTRAFSGPLQTFDDYDAVRNDIQTVFNATTPTPARNEIFVAMLPTHQSGNWVFGSQLEGSLVSTVGRDELFSHELGHWLLPGNDHVAGCVNPSLALTQIDTSYPDYPNATQPAGIGEWGVDLEPGAPQLHQPERGDIMSYCDAPRWISPYNYLRAFSGPVLSWSGQRSLRREDGQKLLVAFRIFRDDRVELRWALHLPGDAPQSFSKGGTDLMLELHDSAGNLLVSSPCHRPADRGRSAVREDFQEVLPWFDNAAIVVLVRERQELARWPVEDTAPERSLAEVAVTPARRDDGADMLRFSLPASRSEKRGHYMLRYTPDDGRTWIPVAINVKEEGMEVESELFRGLTQVKLQLAVATGFRTTIVESPQPVVGARMARSLEIIQPAPDTRLMREDSVSLAGTVPTRLDGSEETVTAYWSSNRDGFLADGLRATVSGLSVGRHILRLTVDDGGGEITKTVVVWVTDRSGSADAEVRNR